MLARLLAASPFVQAEEVSADTRPQAGTTRPFRGTSGQVSNKPKRLLSLARALPLTAQRLKADLLI